MKQRGKRLLSVLLTLVMLLGMVPGYGMKALAYDNNPYADLVNTTTAVKFNNIDWYVIADNSAALNEGTVTLLAKDPIAAWQFNSHSDSSKSNEYSSSTVKTALEQLTESGGSFADVADAIVAVDLSDVKVTGAKLWLLSESELNSNGFNLSAAVKKCSQADGASANIWWLRTEGYYNSTAKCVDGNTGSFGDDDNKGLTVTEKYGVRPALKLDLSKVSFDSTNNTFAFYTNPVAEVWSTNSDGTYKTKLNEYTTLQDALDAAGSGNIVKLLKDVTESVTFTGTKTITGGGLSSASPLNVTLDLAGHGITGSGNTVIKIKGGSMTGQLQLMDSAPDTPHKYSVDATTGLATVSESGDPTFTGGYITGGNSSTGGAVEVSEGATFNMSAGTIIGNRSNGGSTGGVGGVFISDGAFHMSGTAVIMYNVGAYGGVSVNDGEEFTMSGGEIKYNTADIRGGGVHVKGTFNMTGGSIHHNTNNSSWGGGGGVNVNSGTFNMSGGRITENRSSYGGGVYATEDARLTLSGAAKITGNTKMNEQDKSNLYLAGKADVGYAKVAIGGDGLSGDKPGIGITLGSGKGVFTKEIADDAKRDAAKPYFFSDDPTLGVLPATVEEGKYQLKLDVSQTLTVTFDANGAESGTAPAAATYNVGDAVPGNTGNMAKKGYTFQGWNTKADGKGTAYKAGDSLGATGDITLYAVWEVNKINVLFYADMEGATVKKTVPDVPEGAWQEPGWAEGKKPADSEMTKDGYTFAGWTTHKKDNADDYSYKVTLPTESSYILADWTKLESDGVNLRLYPVFIKHRLRVFLDVGAKDANANATNLNGWAGNGKDSITPAVTMDAGQYRRFTLNSGEKLTMTAMNNASRDGYTLDGWYTKTGVKWNADWGADPEYCDRDDTEKPVLTKDETNHYSYYQITLTAVWNAVAADDDASTHTVTYIKDDDVFHTDALTPGAPITPPEVTDTRDGYTPAWSPELPETMPRHNLTVHLVWVPRQYTIYVYQISGDTTPIRLVTENVGAHVTEPVLTWDGRVFDGWTENDSDATFPTYMEARNSSFYAKWRQAPTTTIVTGAGTPDVSADLSGLIADTSLVRAIDSGETVEVKLTVAKKDDLTAKDPAGLTPEQQLEQTAQREVKEKATNAASGATVEFLDMGIMMSRTQSGGSATTTPILDTGNNVMAIRVTYTTANRSIKIYRNHVDANGHSTTIEFKKLASENGAHSDGEYYVGNGYVVIYASKFSTYAIAYTATQSNNTNNYTSGGSSDSSSDSYAVTVAKSANGTAKANTSSASGGSRVTVTATPESGYQVGGVTVTDKNGRTVPVTRNSDGTYRFTMPESAVTVNVSFARKLTNPTDTGVSKWLNTVDHILYIRGYNENGVSTVRPDNNITRAEAAMMFYRLLKNQDVTVTKTFTDVSEGQWYAQPIGVLASLGIVGGYGDGTFQPNRTISRAEFAKIATKFATLTGGKAQFKDVSEGHWASGFIATAADYGWIGGYEDGTYRPDGFMTRAAAAKIINYMLGRSADREYVLSNRENLVKYTDLTDPSVWYYFEIVEASVAHDFTVTDGVEKWK